MARILKTAPELERFVLRRITRIAPCSGIGAVTVRADPAGEEGDWQVSDIYVPGGVVPTICREACVDAVAALGRQFALLPLDQLEPDDEIDISA